MKKLGIYAAIGLIAAAAIAAVVYFTKQSGSEPKKEAEKAKPTATVAPTVPAGHVALWRPERIVEERKVDDKTSKTVYELKYDELGRCTQYTEKNDNIARRTIVWEYNDEGMTTKETNTQFNDGKWAYQTVTVYDAEGLEIFRESFRYDEPIWTKYESTARSVVIGPGGNPIVLMETTGFNYTGKEKSNEMRQVYEPETMTLRNQKRMNDSEEWRDTETFVFDELGRTVSSCSYDIYGKKLTESQTSYNADGTGISRNYTAYGSLCDTIELDSKGREVKRTHCNAAGETEYTETCEYSEMSDSGAEVLRTRYDKDGKLLTRDRSIYMPDGTMSAPTLGMAAVPSDPKTVGVFFQASYDEDGRLTRLGNSVEPFCDFSYDSYGNCEHYSGQSEELLFTGDCAYTQIIVTEEQAKAPGKCYTVDAVSREQIIPSDDNALLLKSFVAGY